MRRWLVALTALASVSALASPAMAREPEAQTAPVPAAQALTLERVFAGPDLAGTQPRAMQLSPDGKWLTLLRNRPEEKERFDLWAMDTTSGQWRMLVDSKKVGSGAELSEEEKMQRERARISGTLGIVAYDWAPDARSILVPLDGELYVAGLDGSVRKLANSKDALNPTVSPRGGYVGFVRGQNLVLADLAQGDERVLTKDGGGTVHWGEAEFVAQEEMDRTTGYWWSPDDSRIAVARFDEAPVGIVSRAAIGAEGTKVYDQRYPRAGTPNVLIELHVLRADGSGGVKVDLGSETDIYLARVNWTADGKALLVQRQSRDQKVLDVLRVDPDTGKAEILFSEKAGPRSWVNLSHTLRPLRDGSLIWWSERDGHGHLYRWQAGKWTQLTKGDWEVAEVSGVDEATGKIYFLGNKDGVLERHLYVADLKRAGTVTRLTEPGWWNSATMDGTASRAIVTRSSPEQPPQIYLADTGGKRLAWVNENNVRAADHPYHPYLAQHRPREFGTIKASDGTVLHWQMVAPKIEPGKRYPVFFQHYGGPHSQNVSRAWNATSPGLAAFHQYLAQQGWIVFVIDNRGAANRGKAFEDPIYQAAGSVEVEDQLAGAAYLKTLPYVDAKRIATYGWSYGGYMTLKMLEAAPGTFAAGVAGAPVSRWELYDTHYTERYMGDPRAVPQAYVKANTVEDALKIADPLLLIHGMADDNVVLEHSTVMMAKLQAGAVPFDVMLYPGQTHRVGGPGVSLHVWRTILDFFDRAGVSPKP